MTDEWHPWQGDETANDAERFRQRFFALGQVTGQSSWITKADGSGIQMPDWPRMTGQSEEVLRSGGWIDAVHPEDRERTISGWMESVAHGKPFDATYRLRSVTGEYRWYRVRGVPVRNEEGSILEWVGAMEDVHEHAVSVRELQHSTQALRESEERFRATFEFAGVGIAHVGLDGRWLRFNRAMADILGYSREELRAMTFADVTHPADLEADWLQARRLMQGQISTYSMEKRYLHKDGRIVWANLTVSLLRDSAGHPWHFISVVEDITSRKEFEQSLRESEDHYRFTVNANPQVPWTAEPNGEIMEFSDRWTKLTGVSREDLRGDGWFRVHHPDDVAAAREAWEQSVQTGKPYEVEFRARMANGEYNWVRSRAVPRTRPDGRIVRWYGNLEDIHAAKMAASELERLVEERTRELQRANEELVVARDQALDAAKAKGQFLANMSHEIRTPMNGVLGMTSLLAQQPLNPEALEMVKTIARSGETLLRVIDDILDVSKIEAGKLEIERSRVDLAMLVSEIISLFTSHAKQKGIELRAILPAEPCPRVTADRIRLKQVLANLVSNSIKFTHEGSVTLTMDYLRQDEQCFVTFTVADTGIGIPEDRVDSVFQSFTQADGSTQRRYGGSGLGLTISKHLVELMGGTISVESRLGVGSVFMIDLKLEVAELWTNRRVETPVRPAVSSRRLRILVAEDNVVNIAVVEGLLELCGCDVEIAENGRDAIDLCRDNEYDAVLMDIQMPECDGLTATRRIREMEAREGRTPLTIYSLTANALLEDRADCLAAGMDGFVAKPITLDSIRDFLAKVAPVSPEAS